MNKQIIEEAIDQKRLIQFWYDGLERIAEPHILGMKNGVQQVLVYQIQGQSKSGKLPNWRRINLREVSNVTMLNQTFPGRRSSSHHSSWDIRWKVVS